MRLAGTFHRDLLIGLALRGAGAVASFALTWLIARIYGPGEVGLFHLGLATALLAGTIVSAGLDIVLVRAMGKLLAEGRWDDIRSTYLRCRSAMLWFGVPAAVLMLALAEPLADVVLDEPRAAPFIMLFAPLAILAPLTKLGNALLRSAGRVIASQMLEGVAYSTVACIALGIAWLLFGNPDPVLPAIAYVVGLGVVFGVNRVLTKRLLRDAPGGGTSAVSAADGLRIAAMQTVTAAGTWAVLALVTERLDIVDAGLFRTAFQVCMVLQLVNAAFAVMAGPHMSKAVAASDRTALLRQVLSGGAMGGTLALPFLLAMLLFAPEILRLFGPEFVRAAPTLRVLVAAPLLDIAFGLTGVALLMMRSERFVLWHEIAANAAGLSVILALLSQFGLVAAALGVATTALLRAILNATRFAIVLRGGLASATDE